MSSTVDYINKPTTQFVEYVANNVVNEFHSSPGMNMSALLHILSIKFSSNPMAGAFAASVRTHGNYFPSNPGYPQNGNYNRPQYNPTSQRDYHDARLTQMHQRSSTPSRDHRENHYNETRGRSMGREEQRTTRAPSAHRQPEPIKRSGTPARQSRDVRDDDVKSTTSSHNEKAPKPAKKTVEKPSNVGLKLFTIEQSPIIKSQMSIPENMLPSEAKRRWSFLTDSERAVYAEKQAAYDEKVTMEKLASKAAERDGFKIFFSETFDLLKSQGITFEPGKKKIEISKRWGKLSPEERSVYASRQREQDEKVRLFIESKIASGAWPQVDEKTLKELKEMRSNQVYLASFNYNPNITPMLSMILFSSQHFFQLQMLLGIPGHVNNLVVDRNRMIPVKSLDEVINAIMNLTGVSIRFPGAVMNSDLKTLWTNFLKSEHSGMFGYTKHIAKPQEETVEDMMENLQLESQPIVASQPPPSSPKFFGSAVPSFSVSSPPKFSTNGAL